jgi:hypothetical protein
MLARLNRVAAHRDDLILEERQRSEERLDQEDEEAEEGASA